MNCPASHQAPVNDKEEDDGVDLERGAFSPNAKGDVFKDPIVGHPPGHNGIDAKGGGNRGAFKVVTLARCILGEVRSGDVKARQADKTAEHEEGETQGVKLSAEAESSSYRGRGNAEGDQISKGVEFLAHHARLFPPPSNAAVHEVEEEAKGKEDEGKIYKTGFLGVTEAVV